MWKPFLDYHITSVSHKFSWLQWCMTSTNLTEGFIWSNEVSRIWLPPWRYLSHTNLPSNPKVPSQSSTSLNGSNSVRFHPTEWLNWRNFGRLGCGKSSGIGYAICAEEIRRHLGTQSDNVMQSEGDIPHSNPMNADWGYPLWVWIQAFQGDIGYVEHWSCR